MNNHEELIQFVLDQAAGQPVQKRIRLYLALAQICGDPAEQTQLNAMADSLVQAETLCSEFKFSFVQKRSGK